MHTSFTDLVGSIEPGTLTFGGNPPDALRRELSDLTPDLDPDAFPVHRIEAAQAGISVGCSVIQPQCPTTNVGVAAAVDAGEASMAARPSWFCSLNLVCIEDSNAAPCEV